MTKNNKRHLLTLLIIPLFAITFAAITTIYYSLKINARHANPPKIAIPTPSSLLSPTQTPNQEPTDNIVGWKIYTNSKYGYSFKYPQNLTLIENNNSITLNHSIPYNNHGDCDMNADTKLYKKLNDFNIIFEIKPQKINPEYTDGQYSAGTLIGVWQWQGAEGCGVENYYFPISNNKTLIVKKSLVQAFSGVSTAWDLDKILNTPGVITKKGSDQLFKQILSTFKLLDKSAITPTTTNSEGKFCGGIAGIACSDGYECVLDGNYPDAGGKCQKMYLR